ncbi:TIGR01777 family oxidoreductase [Paenibacillus ginsengarvi]|uniref:TIGR01777 family protein n=1 Tax=Paenibacillus ginsengarvi TaxID=400777 RepID=A0A3B0CIB3_9BACL|nr:TIGR01777 family oxidoreductase [Paenibacillus ginsengarvi]RKN84049.1 TIGR01777 family protein [Paenibacillus ginsengarvi]
MKIAVCGGTGFIGSKLIRYLQSCGDELILVSRKSSGGTLDRVRTVSWDQLMEKKGSFEGLDGIVNLTGETINQRWSAAAKRRVLESRLEAAARLAELTEALDEPPKAVVNGSAVGVYAPSETAVYDETTGQLSAVDFLSGIVLEWERAAQSIRCGRLVLLRTGVVLAGDGGALPLMALPFKLGAGGKVGSGRQWMSWIHADDIVRLIRHCIENAEVQGPVNATAPNPVTNETFGRALAQTLRRPFLIPAPAFALRLVLGEMADMLLTGQNAVPVKALESGFAFRYPTVDKALQAIYTRNLS